VVSEVPLTGESTSGVGALASFISAEERLVTVTMHGVGLALMAKKACRGGKPCVLTRLDLAAIGLQMGIHEFAACGAAWLVGER
jgi:hypothetical protein